MIAQCMALQMSSQPEEKKRRKETKRELDMKNLLENALRRLSPDQLSKYNKLRENCKDYVNFDVSYIPEPLTFLTREFAAVYSDPQPIPPCCPGWDFTEAEIKIMNELIAAMNV